MIVQCWDFAARLFSDPERKLELAREEDRLVKSS